MGRPREYIVYQGHMESSDKKVTNFNKFRDGSCLWSVADDRRNHHSTKLTDSSGMIGSLNSWDQVALHSQKPGGWNSHKKHQGWNGSQEDVICQELWIVNRLWHPSGQNRCASNRGIIQLYPQKKSRLHHQRLRAIAPVKSYGSLPILWTWASFWILNSLIEEETGILGWKTAIPVWI